jgi:signal transduction histidine kinase
MKVQLLEVGNATDLLSSCRLSLILGVFSSRNLIDTFLKLSRKTLQAKSGILAFNQEPYQWHSSIDGFHACEQTHDEYISSLFDGAAYIDQSHHAYEQISNYLHELDIDHQRLIAFNLKISGHHTVGQVIFYDDQYGEFLYEDVMLIEELADGLVGIIRQHEEYNELKELYEQQTAINFSKTKFFQIIAHDLRAPFHGLLGFTDVLTYERHTLDEESLQNITEYLYDTAQSTYNLLESLLNWAMAEGGRFIYHPINFDLDQASNIVCNVLNGLALKKNIRLVDGIPKGTKVYADINMVTSVIQNLVSNALKFTPDDGSGEVIIGSEVFNGHVFISIQDTGLGMSEQQIEKLFEPKLTISTKGTNGEKGTGLGLILCKRFVDLNQGQIQVESKKGHGTIFKVSFPEAINHTVLNHDNKLASERRQLKT